MRSSSAKLGKYVEQKSKLFCLKCPEWCNVQKVNILAKYFIYFVLELHLLSEEALDIVHVTKDGQESAFAMLAVVLWLAIDTRDALAKSIYSCLFDWLIEQINHSLGVSKRCTGKSTSILDVYGFESVEK